MNLNEDFATDSKVKKTVESLLIRLEENKFPHAIIFHGENEQLLENVALFFSEKILNGNVQKHPDFHTLFPIDKVCKIKIEDTVNLIRKIQVSPLLGDKKVVLIYSPERMNLEAANSFLKTLEEPPEGTTIFLITTFINKVLPTITSRCVHFYLNGIKDEGNELWQAWRNDFKNWILNLIDKSNRSSTDKIIFKLYELAARFDNCIEETIKDKTAVIEKRFNDSRDISKKEAQIDSLTRKVRVELLTSLQESLLEIPVEKSNEKYIRCVEKTSREIENVIGLMELNAQEAVLIESLLLKCLRIWTI